MAAVLQDTLLESAPSRPTARVDLIGVVCHE